jgi:hypothetical protein
VASRGSGFPWGRRIGKGRPWGWGGDDEGAAPTHLRVEGGGAGVGVHVPGGGRRLRECRNRVAGAGPRSVRG